MNKIYFLKFYLSKNFSFPQTFIFFSGILVIMIFLSLSFNSIKFENIVNLNLNIATILSTIFAISVSLSLIGFQYLSQNVSTKLLKHFFRSFFIIFMIMVYLFSIIFSLFLVAINSDSIWLLNLNFTLFIFCLLYLVGFFYFIVISLQENNILKLIGKKLSKNDYNDENYDIIKEICLKAIRNNNFGLYRNSLNMLNKGEIYFLKKIKKKKLNLIYTLDSRHSEVENLIYEFIHLQKQIFYELIEYKREIFLLNYINWLYEIQKISFPLLAIRPYQDLMEHFNKIGDIILKNNFEETYLFYSQRLRDITEHEFKSIPKNELKSYYDLSIKADNESKYEKDKKTLLHIAFEDFRSKRLGFIREICIQAINENKKTLDHFSKHILETTLRQSISIKDNDGLRWNIIQDIVYSFRKIHEANINNEIYENFYSLDLHYLIENLTDETEINRIGGFLTHEYCNAHLELVKINAVSSIRDLGVSGRFLNKDKKFEIVIKLLSETFDLILKDFSKKKITGISKDYISSELYSILGKVDENNKHIKKIIKKHKLKPSKNVYMMGIFMGTKKDWKKKNEKQKANEIISKD